MNTFINCNCQC